MSENCIARGMPSMFSLRTLPVLIGILVMSGMFLAGQDTWAPPAMTSMRTDTEIRRLHPVHTQNETATTLTQVSTPHDRGACQ